MAATNVPATRSLAQLVASLGPQSPLAKTSTVDPRSLSAGIKASFASMTFKGKVWGIRHRGTTSQLLQRDPNTGAVLGSVPTVDIVIVRTANAIGKSYYIEKYKEGDFNQPDCWSTNGVVPDTAAPHKQNPTCRGCKWDAFGSRTMDDGRKGKACQDSKRLAVLPAADLKNEAFGGPMLLKLPPSAFNGLSELEMQLHMQGYNYWGVVMRLSFDHQAAFPKIMFTPARVLNDHEMQEVLNWQTNELVDRILSEEVVEVTGDPGQPDPGTQTPAPVVTPVVTPTPAPAPATTAFVPQPPPASAQNHVAAASHPVQPSAAPDETEAQKRIRELEAQLAEASKPKTRKRSSPVTPNGQAAPTVQASPEPVQAGQDDDEGDAPADLEDKIDALLKS